MSLKQDELADRATRGTRAENFAPHGPQPNEKSHEGMKLGAPEPNAPSYSPPSNPNDDRGAAGNPRTDGVKIRNWPSPLTTMSSVWGNSASSASGWAKSPKHLDYVSLGPLSADYIGMSPLARNLQHSENWRVVGSPATKASNQGFQLADDSLDLRKTQRQRASSVIDPLNTPLDDDTFNGSAAHHGSASSASAGWGALGLKWTGMNPDWSDTTTEVASLRDSERDELVLPKFGRTRSKSQSMDKPPGCIERDMAQWPKVGELNSPSASVSRSTVESDDLKEMQQQQQPSMARRHSLISDHDEDLVSDMSMLQVDAKFHLGEEDTRVRSLSDSAKQNQSQSHSTAPFHLSSYRGVLYLIEFKAGRIEVYYVPESSGTPQLQVRVGDLVIVEADRGEDLGKITGEITVERLKQLITPEDLAQDDRDDDSNPYGSLGIREIIPKRIHRLAQSADLRLAQAKAQEEAIAMVRCQSRVRQKKLPMEVVDAEYQWCPPLTFRDRNKLTFYFVADRRIDFRELVRDLFRIYKTRIWMCAVDKNRSLYAKLRAE